MSLTPPIANFERAEFPGDAPRPDHCVYCNRGITTEYYRVDGNMACPVCAEQAQSLIPPDSHRAYSRAVLFGVAASVAGCIGYALFTILSGITLGYAAIAVGWMVGKAMHSGSRGIGGKRYQWTAAALTYAAVAVAFVPIVLHEHGLAARKPHAEKLTQFPAGTTQPLSVPQNSTSQRFPYPGEASGKGSSPAPADAAKADEGARPNETSLPAAAGPAPPAQKPAPTLGAFLLACILLLGLGLISPFLVLASSPVGGLIGIFIIFLGLSTAWRMTAKKSSEVDGPFQMTSPPPLSAST